MYVRDKPAGSCAEAQFIDASVYPPKYAYIEAYLKIFSLLKNHTDRARI